MAFLLYARSPVENRGRYSGLPELSQYKESSGKKREISQKIRTRTGVTQSNFNMVQRKSEKPKKQKISRKQQETYQRIAQREADKKGRKK